MKDNLKPSAAVREQMSSSGDSTSELNGVTPLVASDEIAALRAIVEGTAHSTCEEFFQTLVRHLAAAVHVHYALVAEFASPSTTTRARTIAFWAKDRFHENLE